MARRKYQLLTGKAQYYEIEGLGGTTIASSNNCIARNFLHAYHATASSRSSTEVIHPKEGSIINIEFETRDFSAQHVEWSGVYKALEMSKGKSSASESA
jgi:hypothetical protein